GLGNTTKALAKYQSNYQTTDNGLLAGGTVPILIAVQPSVIYRDYLRTIFTGPTSSPSYPTYLKQLKDPFHQDFTTNDNSALNANGLVCGILPELLPSPPGATYGFGVGAATIQPKGQNTDRAYLDYLIKLTGLSQSELEHRYRLNLSRLDGEQSDPVS